MLHYQWHTSTCHVVVLLVTCRKMLEQSGFATLDNSQGLRRGYQMNCSLREPLLLMRLQKRSLYYHAVRVNDSAYLIVESLGVLLHDGS